ncbi:MAG: 50S ribosomal protein L20 [Beijerinckiaceae bacterium]
MTYSAFIAMLTKAGMVTDRKMLSELAIAEPAAFTALVEKVKTA